MISLIDFTGMNSPAGKPVWKWAEEMVLLPNAPALSEYSSAAAPWIEAVLQQIDPE